MVELEVQHERVLSVNHMRRVRPALQIRVAAVQIAGAALHIDLEAELRIDLVGVLRIDLVGALRTDLAAERRTDLVVERRTDLVVERRTDLGADLHTDSVAELRTDSVAELHTGCWEVPANRTLAGHPAGAERIVVDVVAFVQGYELAKVLIVHS